MSHSNVLAPLSGWLWPATLAWGVALVAGWRAAGQSLLNVSYDPTRGIHIRRSTPPLSRLEGQGPAKPGPGFQTSHNGSGAQARAVIDGLQGRVVTLGVRRRH